MLKFKDDSLLIKGILGKLYLNKSNKQLINTNINGSRLIWNHDVAILKQQPLDFKYQWVKAYQNHVLPQLLTLKDHRDLIYQFFTNVNLKTYLAQKPNYYYQYPTHYVYHFDYDFADNDKSQFNIIGLYQVSINDLKHTQLKTAILRPIYHQIQDLDQIKWSNSKRNKIIHNYRQVLMQPRLDHLNHDHLTYTEELSNRYFKKLVKNPETNKKELKYVLPQKYPSQYDLGPLTTKLINNGHHPWLKSCDANALRTPDKNISDTLNRFFKNPRQYGFPRFKSYRYAKQSYTTNPTMKKDKITKEILNSTLQVIDDEHIKLPKVGIVRCNKLTQDFENILPVSITITRDPRNNYYFSLTCYYQSDVNLSKTNKAIGLDLNVSNNYATSDGNIIESVDYNAINARMLRIWERRFAKRQLLAKQRALQDKAEANRISNHNLTGRDYKTFDQYQNVKKARNQIYRIKHHQANVRKMRLQKLTTALVKKYDIIAIEDLQVSNMLKNHKLAKAIANQGWRNFRIMLEYKCEKFHKQLVVVNPRNTSQTCSNCGYVKGQNADDEKLTLADREWTCPQCHQYHIRDVNAAKNILKLGLDQLQAAK